MTHTEKIIKDAYTGGYESTPVQERDPNWCLYLDPSFWQAVGKTRHWTEDVKHGFPTGVNNGLNYDWTPKWIYKWHQFINHLAEGDDYETALSKLN